MATLAMINLLLYGNLAMNNLLLYGNPFAMINLLLYGNHVAMINLLLYGNCCYDFQINNNSVELTINFNISSKRCTIYL